MSMKIVCDNCHEVVVGVRSFHINTRINQIENDAHINYALFPSYTADTDLCLECFKKLLGNYFTQIR